MDAIPFQRRVLPGQPPADNPGVAPASAQALIAAISRVSAARCAAESSALLDADTDDHRRMDADELFGRIVLAP